MMKIPIKTNKSKYHRQILEMIKALPPFNELRPKELDLLAEIMKQYQEYTEVPRSQRKHLIFSSENRNKMQEHLKVSKGNMNTYLVKIRKCNLLSKDNDLLPSLDIPFGEFDIDIKFIVNG